MPITIREIDGDAELEAVAAFRYSIYVEEMGRAQKYADPIAKRVLEPLDEGARITAAFDDDGQIVGTVRTNYLCESEIGEYREFYRIDDFGPPFEDHTTITTKHDCRTKAPATTSPTGRTRSRPREPVSAAEAVSDPRAGVRPNSRRNAR